VQNINVHLVHDLRKEETRRKVRVRPIAGKQAHLADKNTTRVSSEKEHRRYLKPKSAHA
jgi:hypothetical protein